ncbi:cytochrome P450 6a8-like [Planococcus citri]|uniref:cytochrome P450 6a8-like n=1 Tax=Planococcus citri TaxID=170843 RepID=UPI0031F8B678
MTTTIFLIILIVLLLLAIFWLYLRSSYQYFKKRNIPYLEPHWLLGNANDLILGRKSILEFQRCIYKATKPTKLLGTFMFQKPTLYVSELEWIKLMLGRDSAHFFDRGLKIAYDDEPLTMNLFHLEGERYKIARNKVLPAFTLNGVLILFPLLLESAINLQHYLGQVAKTTEDINLREVMSRYAAEVIGKCAFGLKKGPLTGNNDKFYHMSKRIFMPRLRTIIKLILPHLPKFITELFDIKMVASDIAEYFSEIIYDELKHRRQQNKRPTDFLSYMMDVQDKDNEECTDIMPITDELIAALCFMLFLAGYENSTVVLCAAIFELGRNPEVQEKLYQEIHSTCGDDLSNLTMNKLKKMPYLHKVVCETLRLYPPATAMVRECTADYQIPGTEIFIEKGLQVVIPFCAMNVDPEYFPTELSYDPENFSEKAIQSRSRYAFLPFGEGPRACGGRKLGMIQMKVGLSALVLKYQFFPSPKMKLPVTFEKRAFIMSIEGGTWTRCKPRCQN